MSRISKVSEGKEKSKSLGNNEAMLDFTNIDHLYVYHHNKHEFSSYRKSFENNVDSGLISSLEIWSIIFLLFCVLCILLRSMKFIQNSITVDVTSFIIYSSRNRFNSRIKAS
jgi:hypothetical protein